MKIMRPAMIALLSLAGLASAAPIAFDEVSLLVRMQESEPSILQQLSQRRLLHALTPEQETKLKTEGATDRLLQALRDPASVLPAGEAVAFENYQSRQQEALAKARAAQIAAEQAEQAARVAAVAAWQRGQDEKAAREREVAGMPAVDATLSSPDYYGSYGYGPYGGYGGGYVRPHGPNGSGHIHDGRGPDKGSSGGSLQWKNGAATTPSHAGISYYAPGSNGTIRQPAETPRVPSAPAAPATSGGHGRR